MTTRRLIGIILFGTASLGTIIASFYLAQQATSDVDVTTIILQSAIAFALLGPLFGIGYYVYITGDTQTNPEDATEMELQRRLVELLDQSGEMSLEELATVLGITPDDVRSMIYDLTRLELFNGVLTPDAIVIKVSDSRLLQMATRCQTCNAPIQLRKGSTICKTCTTEYLLS